MKRSKSGMEKKKKEIMKARKGKSQRVPFLVVNNLRGLQLGH